MQPKFLDVPEHTWVKLARATRSDNVSHDAGDTCSLMKGASVEIIGTDPAYGTLVRYSLPSGELAAGALCPDQSLIFLSSKQIESWPSKGVVTRSMAIEKQRKEDSVKRLLGEL